MEVKGTGIVRRIDDLGRIAIPREIRERVKFVDGDALEIFIVDGGLFIKSYEDKSLTDDDIKILKQAKDILKVIYDDTDVDNVFKKIL